MLPDANALVEGLTPRWTRRCRRRLRLQGLARVAHLQRVK
jgi:hypothetical protein